MMRFLILVLFSLVLFSEGHAQQSKSEYVNMELSILHKRLAQCGPSCTLTNVQLADLHVVFAEKADKVILARQKFGSKDNLSVALRKIEEEFAPRIAGILQPNQRMFAEKLKQ